MELNTTSSASSYGNRSPEERKLTGRSTKPEARVISKKEKDDVKQLGNEKKSKVTKVDSIITIKTAPSAVAPKKNGTSKVDSKVTVK